MNTDVFVNFVLDKSGSMQSIQADTIGGFNSFLEEQKQAEGLALLSLTLFSTSFDVRFVARDIREVPMLGSAQNTYRPSGGTALFDAIGTTIKGTEEWLKNHDFNGKVITVILTDGEENSSKSWHANEHPVVGDPWDVNGLISYKQNEGWEFIYLGCGRDAWSTSRVFASSIGVNNSYNYAGDAASNRQTYAGMSSALLATRSTGIAYAAAASSTLSEVRVDDDDDRTNKRGA